MTVTHTNFHVHTIACGQELWYEQKTMTGKNNNHYIKTLLCFMISLLERFYLLMKY